MAGSPFHDPRDISNLQRFLVEMRHQVGQGAYFQLGDLLWRMHHGPNNFDAAADLRLWRNSAGGIDGFVFHLQCDGNPEFFLRPELYDSVIAGDMLAWALGRARAGNLDYIETSCIDGDAAKSALLSRWGFRLIEDDAMLFMARDLADPIPDATLPEGYTFVSGAERPDLPGVTGRPLSQDAYAYLRQAPGYRDDLGLRVCYENREIVAGCIGWYDALDACGEFEPVGTRADHRRRGLAFAVMAAVMMRLKQYGAETAYIRTYGNNAAAVHLYRKLGFKTVIKDLGWRRPVERAI